MATYQWKRCNADLTGLADIAGETSTSYLLDVADEGKRIRVAKTDAGVTVLSSPTAVIRAAGAGSGWTGGDGTVGSVIFNDPFNTTYPTNTALNTAAEPQTSYGPKGSGSNIGRTWTEGVSPTPGTINHLATAPTPGIDGDPLAVHVYLPAGSVDSNVSKQAHWNIRYWNMPPNGTVQYFGMMWYFPTGFKNMAGSDAGSFLECWTMAYPPFIKGGAMLGLWPWDYQTGDNGMKIQSQSGYGAWAANQPPTAHQNGQSPKSKGTYTELPLDAFYIIPQGDLDKNVWHQTILRVKWTTANDGEIDGWWKRKGESAWNHTVNESTGRPTVWWGIDQFGINWSQAEVLPVSGKGVNTSGFMGAYRNQRTYAVELWYKNFCHATGFGAIADRMPN